MFKNLINLFRKPVPVVVEPVKPGIIAPQTSGEIEQMLERLHQQIENYSTSLKKVKEDEFELFKQSKPRFCKWLDMAGVDLSLILNWDAATKAKHREYAESYRQRAKAYMSSCNDYDTLSLSDMANLKRGEIYLDFSIPDAALYTIKHSVRYDFEDISKQFTARAPKLKEQINKVTPIKQYKKWDLSNDPNYKPESEVKIGEVLHILPAIKAKSKSIIKTKIKTKSKAKKKIIKKK